MPLQASVLFLRIAGFAGLSEAERSHQRERLLNIVQQLVPKWPEDGRVVLEADDGAAIVSLDDPVKAMDAGRRAGRKSGFMIGLHHGPVRSLTVERVTVLAGDGIETAQSVAGLSQEHPVVATREFRQALRAAAPDRAEALVAAGNFVDERFRAYELFAPDAEAAKVRRSRRMIVGGVTLAGILGIGWFARVRRKSSEAARRRGP